MLVNVNFNQARIFCLTIWPVIGQSENMLLATVGGGASLLSQASVRWSLELSGVALGTPWQAPLRPVKLLTAVPQPLVNHRKETCLESLKLLADAGTG